MSETPEERAFLAERQRCRAALCPDCADATPAVLGYPGDPDGEGAEWWHGTGLARPICLASKLRRLP